MQFTEEQAVGLQVGGQQRLVNVIEAAVRGAVKRDQIIFGNLFVSRLRAVNEDSQCQIAAVIKNIESIEVGTGREGIEADVAAAPRQSRYRGYSTARTSPQVKSNSTFIHGEL